MESFKDPARLTRFAVVALSTWMAVDLLYALLSFAEAGPGGPAALVAIPRFLVLLSCFVLVGMWIYRTNANAHALGGDVSIAPGWAVGWFAVPFANLVMPYQGVSETWQASHEMAGLDGDAGLPLVRWWWGLWLVSGFFGYFALIFGGVLDGGVSPSSVLLIHAMFQIALSVVLIRLMRKLAAVQALAAHGSAFA
jgi:hypothetical protein